MNLTTVRCVGNQEVAVVAVGYDLLRNQVCIAELIRLDADSLTRRVNPETLDLAEYPELYELMNEAWEWEMDAVQDFVIGYLNRHSVARVRLHPTWESELSDAQV